MTGFAYARPERLDDAVELLAGPGAVALAGGTDLLVGLRHGTVAPRLVVDLKRVRDLPGAVTVRPDAVSVGGRATMTEIVDHPVLRDRFPALVEAAVRVGSVQIRNRATLAGNLCHASPAADTAPPLLALGASVTVAGPEGVSTVDLDDFFLGPGRTVLRPGDVVVSVDLPLIEPLRSGFARMTRRRGVDLATVSVACAVGGSGTTRLGLGAVGPRPLLGVDDSGVLADPAADPDARDAALAATLAVATPISDVRAGADYRAAMLAVLARRTLDRVTGAGGR